MHCEPIMPRDASSNARLDALEKIMNSQRDQIEKLIKALVNAERELARATGDSNEDALSLISGYAGAMPLGTDYTANTRSSRSKKKTGGKKKKKQTGGKKKKVGRR